MSECRLGRAGDGRIGAAALATTIPTLVDEVAPSVVAVVVELEGGFGEGILDLRPAPLTPGVVERSGLEVDRDRVSPVRLRQGRAQRPGLPP